MQKLGFIFLPVTCEALLLIGSSLVENAGLLCFGDTGFVMGPSS